MTGVDRARAGSPAIPFFRTGDPAEVGVCLSGGGIRAASFALGVLQQLQAERQLLFGPNCADYLAAVSGGSYVAATHTIVARQISRGETRDTRPPLHPDAPEAKWILDHGDYLKHWGARQWLVGASALVLALSAAVALAVLVFGLEAPRPPRGPAEWLGVGGTVLLLVVLACLRWLTTAAVFAFYALVNLCGVAMLFLLAAGMLVGLAEYVPEGIYRPAGLPWPAWVAVAGGAVVAARLLLRTLYRVGLHWERRTIYTAALVLCAPSLLHAFGRDRRLVLLVVGVAALLFIVYRQRSNASVRVVAVLTAVTLALQLAGFAWLVETATRVQEGLSTDENFVSWLVPATVVAMFVTSTLLARVSLHQLNRNRVSWCFCIERDGADARPVPPATYKLSDFTPEPDAGDARSPRLFICATANVDLGKDQELPDCVASEWRLFQPFIFSPQTCGVPGVAEASFNTAALEQEMRPAWFRREPAVTLMTAVGCSGAAVAPGMGKMTAFGVRSLIALTNLRLGTWLPNPYSSEVREWIMGRECNGDRKRTRKCRWLVWPPALGKGYDEFVPELFGLQRADAPRAYLSDGGHDDNLGLLTLLRARCREIWCVDSQADRHGNASQLRRTLELAVEQGLIDEKATRLDPAPGEAAIDDPQLYRVFHGCDGKLTNVHAVLRLRYRNGGEVTLAVIKLGLRHEATPSSRLAALEHYAASRRTRLPALRFPVDSTFVRVAYTRDRMEKYSELGRYNAARAIDAMDAVTTGAGAAR